MDLHHSRRDEVKHIAECSFLPQRLGIDLVPHNRRAPLSLPVRNDRNSASFVNEDSGWAAGQFGEYRAKDGAVIPVSAPVNNLYNNGTVNNYIFNIAAPAERPDVVGVKTFLKKTYSGQSVSSIKERGARSITVV
jgi:hypothetical protein